jgi:hypothetical protein
MASFPRRRHLLLASFFTGVAGSGQAPGQRRLDAADFSD